MGKNGKVMVRKSSGLMGSTSMVIIAILEKVWEDDVSRMTLC